ncbi:hypothetical protein B0H16DRAFT_1464067 [Mycena metata]|uniref:Uncharacterized protein n=1 Tax=Mycena metata TaxID=1033252 RepID=A0AAD7IGJ3_9AGAR|nr:hypothetical protein B0H16DRAFT_1464067 [Mycena metata]
MRVHTQPVPTHQDRVHGKKKFGTSAWVVAGLKYSAVVLGDGMLTVSIDMSNLNAAAAVKNAFFPGRESQGKPSPRRPRREFLLGKPGQKPSQRLQQRKMRSAGRGIHTREFQTRARPDFLKHFSVIFLGSTDQRQLTKSTPAAKKNHDEAV